MIVKVLAGLATAAIVSAVAAHRVPAAMDEGDGRPAHQQPGPAQAFPLAAKGDRLGIPGAKTFITIEHRAGHTSILTTIPAHDLASR
jgi:hypothetical protein